MKFIWSCLFLLICPHLVAQNIRGIVIDSISGEPVPYATLQYSKVGGVISNEEGFFQLPPEIHSEGTLIISSMGYEKKSVRLADLDPKANTIRMKQSVVQLDEVFISNKVPDAYSILAKVREHLPNNYQADHKTYRIFSRETEYVDFEEMGCKVTNASGVARQALDKTNMELDSLAEVIVKNRSIHFRDYLGSLYMKDATHSKLQVEKATSLLDTKKDFSLEKVQEKAQGIVLQYLDTTLSYKLKTGILKIEDSLRLDEEFKESEKPQTYLTADLHSQTEDVWKTTQFTDKSFLTSMLEPHAYKFKFLRATFLNDELIYVLGFTPNRGRAKFTGKLYVNGNDYAVVKIDYGYADGKRGKKMNLKFLLGIKYVEDTENGTILFKKNALGTYDPNYIRKTEGSYFYVNRPVKFIENSRERDRVKFNFVIAGHQTTRAELLITSTGKLMAGDFEKIPEPDKIPYQILNSYDDTLWEGEETLQPLEEMRQFEAIP